MKSIHRNNLAKQIAEHRVCAELQHISVWLTHTQDEVRAI
jgi:hypothetical protein